MPVVISVLISVVISMVIQVVRLGGISVVKTGSNISGNTRANNNGKIS